MAKFIYKMQNILSIKYKLEDQAKSAFGQAKMALDEEEEKLRVLTVRKEDYEGVLRGEIRNKLNIREIIHCQEAIEILKYQMKLQQVVVNAAKQRLELARVKLNEAMIERKTQEKLKETAFEDFKKEVNAEEQKEINELVSFTYAKNKRNEG